MFLRICPGFSHSWGFISYSRIIGRETTGWETQDKEVERETYRYIDFQDFVTESVRPPRRGASSYDWFIVLEGFRLMAVPNAMV